MQVRLDQRAQQIIVAGGGDHTENEFVDLTSIPLQAKRAAILMSRLSREKAR